MKIHRFSTLYVALAVAALRATTAREDDTTTDTTDIDERTPPTLPKGFIPPFPPVMGVDKAEWEAIKQAHPNKVMTTDEWADFFIAHPMPPTGMNTSTIVAMLGKFNQPAHARRHPHAMVQEFNRSANARRHPHRHGNPDGNPDENAIRPHPRDHHGLQLPPFPPCGVSDADWQQVLANHPNGWTSDEELAQFIVDHPFPAADMTKEELVAYLEANPCPRPHPRPVRSHQRGPRRQNRAAPRTTYDAQSS